MQNKKIQFQDLGRVGYQEAWEYQEKLFKQIHDLKVSNRNLAEDEKQETPNYLIFCEHPHVYTLGKSGDFNNLLIGEEKMEAEEIEFVKTNRGGDITYHGPGQIVGYPVLDLDNFFTDIHKYMRLLEETIIKTLQHYNIRAERSNQYTGVWLDVENPAKGRKICAQGVKCSRWITMHGWALNVNTSLSYFDHIVPCGIQDKAVTSMEKELGQKIEPEPVKEYLKNYFERLFEAELATDLPHYSNTT